MAQVGSACATGLRMVELSQGERAFFDGGCHSLVYPLFVLPVPFADVGDFMVIAVGSELDVPMRIGESQSSAAKGMIPSGSLTKLPDVEGSGCWKVALDAGWPLSFGAIGLDYAGLGVGVEYFRGISPLPLALLVGVFLWPTGRTVVQGLVAVVAHTIPGLGVLDTGGNAVIPISLGVGTRRAGLNREDSSSCHEDKGSGATLSALAEEPVGLYGLTFEPGLTVIGGR